MNPHYRHTQVGWVMVGGVCAAAVAGLVLAPIARAPLPVAVVLPLVAVMLVLFAALTVEVDGDEIRLGFTAGLVHKRIPVAEVARFRRVRNAWWYGFGIRYLPGGGRLWNVSGLDAVELTLKDGGRFRIGTDQPVALTLALAHALGRPPEPSTSSAAEPDRPPGNPARLALVGAVLVVAGVLAVLAVVSVQTRPPKVTVTPQAIVIDSLFYGDTYPMAEVTGVSLPRCLPRILARSNGFAGGGLLRGWFDVQGMGRTKLFVDAGASPYVVLQTRRGFVAVNFSDPQRTQALYEEIVAARGGPQGSGLVP